MQFSTLLFTTEKQNFAFVPEHINTQNLSLSDNNKKKQFFSSFSFVRFHLVLNAIFSISFLASQPTSQEESKTYEKKL